MGYANKIEQEELDIDTGVDVEAVGHLTLRLAQLLAEEVDVLAGMRIQDMVPLQEEKHMLVRALERQRRLLDRHPEVGMSMNDEQRDYLSQVVGIFDQVLKENHARLRVARDVNRAMVGAIQEAIQEHASRGIYSVRGVAEINPEAVSLSLNNIV